MPNTLTVDLASLNKDQIQRIWNVLYGEPEIDYKHAHAVDKVVHERMLESQRETIRGLEAALKSAAGEHALAKERWGKSLVEKNETLLALEVRVDELKARLDSAYAEGRIAGQVEQKTGGKLDVAESIHLAYESGRKKGFDEAKAAAQEGAETHAADAYRTGKEDGERAYRATLPVEDVDGLHKAALAVCDDAQNRNETDGDDYVVDKNLVLALREVSCWSPAGKLAKRRRGPFLTLDFEEPTKADAFPTRTSAEAQAEKEYLAVRGEYGFVHTVYGYIGLDSVEFTFENSIEVKVMESDLRNDILRHHAWDIGGLGCIDPYWNVKIIGDLPEKDRLGNSTEGLRSCWIAGKTVVHHEQQDTVEVNSVPHTEVVAASKVAEIAMFRRKAAERTASYGQGTVEVLPVKPPPFEVWSSGHNTPADPTWKRTFHIRRADPYCDEWMVGFGVEEQAQEVIRLIESGDLDPDLVTPGSAFVSFMPPKHLVIQGPKDDLPVRIRFAKVDPRKYVIVEDDNGLTEQWTIAHNDETKHHFICGFRSRDRDAMEIICAALNLGDLVVPPGFYSFREMESNRVRLEPRDNIHTFFIDR